jgi:hypothetical protein
MFAFFVGANSTRWDDSYFQEGVFLGFQFSR